MPDSLSTLSDAVERFANALCHLTPEELGSPTWAWNEYVEVRYAFLQGALDLEDLAVRLAIARGAAGQPPSAAQRILAQHQAAWRALAARLVGLDDAAANQQPSPTDWSVRKTLVHAFEVEGSFFGAILGARRDLRSGAAPHRVMGDEGAALVGETLSEAADLSYAALVARFTALHARIQSTLADLSDAELEAPSVYWEATHYPVRFRLHRFAAHMKEHTNQVDQVLAATGRAPGEAMLLVHQLYGALAQVEGVLLGAAPEIRANEAITALAAELEARAPSVLASIDQTRDVLAAAVAGDVAVVQRLLAANKALANARNADGLSAVMLALYNGHQDAADALLAADPAELRLSDFAAGGRTDTVREWLDWAPQLLDKPSVDGFTALHLASFFGRLPVVQLLLERGANVHIVSENAMGVQALHSAAAGRHFEVVKALVEAGADVNAVQEGGYRPLDAAIQNGDEAMAVYLRERGAVIGQAQ